MKKYKKDKNTFWEDTGKIKIHNYPPSNTNCYITRIYIETKTNKSGSCEVDGKPFYFHNMTLECMSLSKIMAEAQFALSNILPVDDSLEEILPF
jgi:hypothetical protein